MMQLLNAGLMEIAYDEGSVLKLTPLAREVLFDGKKIELVQPMDVRERVEKARENNAS